MELQMTEQAKADCKGWNPNQTCAFVCESRAKTARVIAVTIGYDDAKRKARIVGGCMRIGRVVNGVAHTI